LAGLKLTRISLKTKRNSRHPWIFSKMVFHPRKRPAPGTPVEVYSRDGDFVGRGFYHPDRTIAVRLLTEDPGEPLDEVFFYERLKAAKGLREDVLRIPEKSDSYRLVHGEGDGLTGLAVDKFGEVLVVEPFIAGYVQAGGMVAAALEELYPGHRIAFRPDPRTEKGEGASFAALAAAYPAPRSVRITENGVRFEVNLETGHKTGYFLDQRDNRARAASLARGRRVFDLFCYSGGFGIQAMFSGAESALGVDLDEKALETAAANARLNGVNLAVRHEDVFNFLRAAIAEKQSADVVIVDPSKLAGVKAEIPRALKTYDDLNRLAMQVVRPGGIIVTCSCSGLISEQQFMSVLANAAGEAGMELQVFDVTGAAPDHPVRTDFPEGKYLTAVFARVLPG